MKLLYPKNALESPVTLDMIIENSDVVYLENSKVRITVGKKEPIIHEYLHKPSRGKLQGEVYMPRR